MVAGRDTHHIAFLAEIVPAVGLPAVETLQKPTLNRPLPPGFEQIPLAIVGAVSGATTYLLCRQFKGTTVQQHRPITGIGTGQQSQPGPGFQLVTVEPGPGTARPYSQFPEIDRLQRRYPSLQYRSVIVAAVVIVLAIEHAIQTSRQRSVAWCPRLPAATSSAKALPRLLGEPSGTPAMLLS